jgi:hypothetical protein
MHIRKIADKKIAYIEGFLYSKKISVNPLPEKLLVERWWIWPKYVDWGDDMWLLSIDNKTDRNFFLFCFIFYENWTFLITKKEEQTIEKSWSTLTNIGASLSKGLAKMVFRAWLTKWKCQSRSCYTLPRKNLSMKVIDFEFCYSCDESAKVQI